MSLSSQHWRWCRFAAIVGLAGVSLAAAEPVVVMPEFVVTADRKLPPPESWRYGDVPRFDISSGASNKAAAKAIPGFEILSSASDKATAKAIGDLQTFILAMEVIMPIPAELRTKPLSVILCGRSGEFARFVPPTAAVAGSNVASASVFLKDGDRAVIVVDLQATVLDISTAAADEQAAVAGNLSGGMRVDPSQLLHLEYIHYLLGFAEPRPPAWLEEGLAQLFMGMTYDRTHIYLAKVDDASRTAPADAGMNALSAKADRSAGVSSGPDTVSAGSGNTEDSTFNVALRKTRLMSFPEIFSVAQDSPTALNPLGSTWAKQCYAFVHLCLFGDKYRYQKGFVQFISDPADMGSEEFFKKCFGAGYNSMLTELRSYIDDTTYTPVELKGSGLPEVPLLTLREATQSEIGRIEGEAFMLGGRHDDARLALRAPYLRGERDPRLVAALGLFESAPGGDAIIARRSLEAAAAAKSTDPRVYLALARLRLAHYEAKPVGDGGRLSAGQAADVFAVLSIARRLPPELPDVYEQTAETWSRSAVAPTPDDLSVLEDGVRFFPTNAGLIYKTAILEAQAGRTANAAVLASLGMKVTAPDTPEHAQFAQLPQQ